LNLFNQGLFYLLTLNYFFVNYSKAFYQRKTLTPGESPMSKDINPIIEGWDYDAHDINVRIIKGLDGKEKIQLRLDLGLLQMELDGRPDGKKPYGKESFLEYYEEMAYRHFRKHGQDAPFYLDTRDCLRLQQEAIQYYHRYLSLMKLGDYQRVVRDTRRNLRVFDLVTKYAKNEDEKRAFEQYRPYVLMMLTRALGSLSLEKKDFDQALRHVNNGIENIRDFYEKAGEDDEVDESFELHFLQSWGEEIKHNRPLSKMELLKKNLKKAIAAENYEWAARLRDELNGLSESHK